MSNKSSMLTITLVDLNKIGGEGGSILEFDVKLSLNQDSINS
ncbi:12482_t:CDS:1, partial [Funneliformis geosporum]